jgi:hypothetical protein
MSARERHTGQSNQVFGALPIVCYVIAITATAAGNLAGCAK